MEHIKKTKVIVGIAMLSAIAIILSYLEFTMPLTPEFAKMDFSDLPALLASFAYGPLAGLGVEVIKNIMGLFSTSTGGIGELANSVIGAAFVVSAGMIYNIKKSRKYALIGMLVGSVVMGIAAAIMNYTVLLPLYTVFLPMDQIIAIFAEFIPFIKTKFDVCLYSAFPSTVFKGIVVSAITFLLYKHLSPVLKGHK